MSVLVLLVCSLGYIHVLEAKEHLSLTDFLLDFLLSLWVPPNYAPSKFTRSVHDPTTKEQLISIEKSKMALDNYINHLLRYARENNYHPKNIKPNSPTTETSSTNSFPTYMCNNPEHQHLYEYAPPTDSTDGQGVADMPDNYPSQYYERNVQPANVFPTYGNENEEDTVDGYNTISGLNICPPSDMIPPPPYPYGCQTKRNVQLDEGIFQGQLLGYSDMYNHRLYDLAKRIWYLNHDKQPKKTIINRSHGQQQRRLESGSSEVPEATSFVSPRHVSYTDNIMSPQENYKNKVAPTDQVSKDEETRIFEEWYLPGFLDELVKNPQTPQKGPNPVFNLPPTYYNYNDYTDAMVANRMLDAKLGNQGSVLSAMTRFEKPLNVPSAQETKEPERKVEKKSENSFDPASTPTHRFGDINSKTTNSDKESSTSHISKPAEVK